MAYDIQHFDGTVIAPNVDYPFGDIKNNSSGTGDGTWLNRKALADMFQYFQKMCNLGKITPSNTPDNADNGFQFVRAAIGVWYDLSSVATAGTHWDITGIQIRRCASGMIQLNGTLVAITSTPSSTICTFTDVDYGIGSRDPFSHIINPTYSADYPTMTPMQVEIGTSTIEFIFPHPSAGTITLAGSGIGFRFNPIYCNGTPSI